MADALQDEDLAKQLVKNQARLETLRSPRESIWREIDERVNVLGGGGFEGGGAFRVRGQQNFDSTAVEGLDRFVGAMKSITVPRNQQWHSLTVADKDLAKIPAVQRWCERATDRLFAIRNAPHAGFGMASSADIRQIGAYGTAPLWIGEMPGRGLFYKAVHLSEIWIDEDFRGRVDTVHRKFIKTARQLQQMYAQAGDVLSPKIAKAIEDNKPDTEFEVLIVIRPNAKREPGRLDWRGMGIESIHVVTGEHWILRRKGFHSMPLIVSRDVLGAGDIYGRSPAMKVLGDVLSVNTLKRDVMRASAKAVDPALAFYSDEGISSLITKPGGLNPGLMDERGNIMVGRIPGGESSIPIGLEAIEQERAPIRTAFLEDFFRVLTNPGDRWTATQVLEMVAKQGVLVAPFAERHETEKMGPSIDRELDLALRAGQIEPLPPEMTEAGAWPKVEYQNPLSKMARAQEASGLTQLIQVLAPIAQADPHVFDVIDTDAAATGVADVLGVRPSWIRSREEVAAIRHARSEAEAAVQGVDTLATAAGAVKDLASAEATAAQAA